MYKDERLSTGTVGWSRSKYTSSQGIMFASLIEFGQNRGAVLCRLGGRNAIANGPNGTCTMAGMGAGNGILGRDENAEAELQKKAKDKDAESDDEDAEWLASVLGGQAETKAKPRQLNPLKPDFPKGTWFHLVRWTTIWFIINLWAMWRYGPRLPVSRRMANLAYIVWVCGFNNAQLLLFCSIEKVLFPNLYDAKDNKTERQRVRDATSRVMQAFNRNGFALFLIANLLTGAINMTMPTLYMDEIPAMVLLVGYTGLICSVALVLDHYNVSIKL